MSKLHIRIFDEGRKIDLPHRRYKTVDSAIDKCLSLLWRLDIGNTFTIYSVRDYRGVIQFTRRLDAIQVLSDPTLKFGSILPTAAILRNANASRKAGVRAELRP